MEREKVVRFIHTDWGVLYHARLKEAFGWAKEIKERLVPLHEQYGECVREWLDAMSVVERLGAGMEEMLPMKIKSIMESDQTKKKSRKILLKIEEAHLIAKTLVLLVGRLEPRKFEERRDSARRRKNVQLLNNHLYAKMKRLYISWLGDLDGYRKSKEEGDDEELVMDEPVFERFENVEGNLIQQCSDWLDEPGRAFWMHELKGVC